MRFCCTRTSGGSRSSSTLEMNTWLNHSGFSQRGQFSLSHSRTWGLMDYHWWRLAHIWGKLTSLGHQFDPKRRKPPILSPQMSPENPPQNIVINTVKT